MGDRPVEHSHCFPSLCSERRRGKEGEGREGRGKRGCWLLPFSEPKLLFTAAAWLADICSLGRHTGKTTV